MLTIAVKFVFIITIVKNFHITLPAFIDKLVELVFAETGKTGYEYQIAEGPFSLDIVLGPAATTTPAPGSKEVQSMPSGTVVPVPTTPETNPVVTSVSGDTMDTPQDPGSLGDAGGSLI
jgi:hypothetical protein